MKVQRQNKIMYNSNVWNSRSKYNIIMNVHTNKHENMFKMIGARPHCINCIRNVGLVWGVLTRHKVKRYSKPHCTFDQGVQVTKYDSLLVWLLP
jgi:hypothetical protein